MSAYTDNPAPSPTTPGGTRFPALLTLVSGILAAPCAVMLVVTPLGLGGMVAAAGGMWLDQHRNWFIAGSLVLLLLTHLTYRRVRQTRAQMSREMGLSLPVNPRDGWLVWLATAVVVVFIAVELIVDNRM